MAFDPTLFRAVDRCRARLGDAADPPILIGGEERYEAILSAAATEVAGYLEAAKQLRAQLVLEPQQRGARGAYVNHVSRIENLGTLIATLEAEVSTAAGSSPITFVTATWGATSTDEYSR
jgi:hypothetical protein